MVKVVIGVVPGEIREIEVNDGTDIRDAAIRAGIENYADYQCRRLGSSVDIDDRVEDGDTIIFTKAIEGN